MWWMVKCFLTGGLHVCLVGCDLTWRRPQRMLSFCLLVIKSIDHMSFIVMATDPFGLTLEWEICVQLNTCLAFYINVCYLVGSLWIYASKVIETMLDDATCILLWDKWLAVFCINLTKFSTLVIHHLSLVIVNNLALLILLLKFGLDKWTLN